MTDQYEVRSVEEALELAQATTGLCDFGRDDTWREGLDVVISSTRESDVPAVHRLIDAEVQRLLTIRLRLQDDLTKHPEIAEVPVERPVFIIGAPRTGTSLLHALLSLDPAARVPLDWEGNEPWPAPELETYTTDPRIAAAEARYEALLRSNPEYSSIHEWGALVPIECQRIWAMHFATGSFANRFGLGRYAAWFGQSRHEGKYRSHRRVLEQLQWKGPRGRWTLKAPEHIYDLAGLVASYPDAVLIQTHREPAQVMGSLASLVHATQSLFVPTADRREVGSMVMRMWAQAFERCTIDRQSAEVDANCMDLSFRSLGDDPVKRVRNIYERFDLEYTDEFHTRMVRYLEEVSIRREQQPAHTYELGDFGMSPEQLADSFPGYRARFGSFF